MLCCFEHCISLWRSNCPPTISTSLRKISAADTSDDQNLGNTHQDTKRKSSSADEEIPIPLVTGRKKKRSMLR